ncbi:hypothetical protein HX049_17515 [Myroides odoratimimus]|uniref:hypothetical protein n=1 Tax=Myroides odoratimimus TaxID=76832 RepID=UPI002575DEB1|nr:hypothetical protein [Myroides odoratimimus]MDM1398938.1 hypothetical protein [Myroides odoratimimus]
MRMIFVYFCLLLSIKGIAQKNVGINTTVPLRLLHIDGKGDNDKGGNNVQAYKNDVVVDSEGKVGIGTIDPNQSLDVRGKTYSEGLILKPESLTDNVDVFNTVPLLIDKNTGVVSLSPTGYSKIIGGVRPHGGTSGSKVIATIPNNNTLIRVKFVIYTHKSSASNNDDQQAYNYGDFVIVGFNDPSSLKIIDAQLKGSDGKVREDATITNTSIKWRSGAQGNIEIRIDAEKKELLLILSTVVSSYLFEIFGGL